MNLRGLKVMQTWSVVRRLGLMGEEVTKKRQGGDNQWK
jgi:hypothetical protein